MLFQSKEMLAGATFGDWFRVIGHGFRYDVCVASALMIFPWITAFASVWVTGQKWPGVANRLYFIFAAMFLSAVFIGNMILYPYQGSPLTASALSYLGNANLFTILGLLFILVVWILINRGLGFATKLINGLRPVINRGWWSAAMTAVGAVLFLGIWWGTGRTDGFSDNKFLNDAAVNPAYSLVCGKTFAPDDIPAPPTEETPVFDSLAVPAADSVPEIITENN